jgi:hypothetical protein
MALGLPFIECFNFPTNLCMSTLFIISNALMKFNDIHNLDLLVLIALKSCHGHKVRFLTTPPPGIISICLYHVSSLVLTIALMVMKGPPN